MMVNNGYTLWEIKHGKLEHPLSMEVYSWENQVEMGDFPNAIKHA